MITDFKIIDGTREIILTGSFLTLGIGETKLTIDPKDKVDEYFNIIFNFKNDSKGESEIGFIARDKHSLAITLTNFNNQLGTGPTDPLKIASNKTSSIYLYFFVYAIADTENKHVVYTIYKEPLVSQKVKKNGKK